MSVPRRVRARASEAGLAASVVTGGASRSMWCTTDYTLLITVINIKLAWSLVIHSRLIRLGRGARQPLVVVTVLGLVLSALAVIQAFALATVFSCIVAGTPIDALAPALVVVAVALLVRPVFVALRELAVHSVAGAVTRSVRGRLLDAEAAAGPLARPDARTGTRQSLLTDGVDGLEPYFGRYVPQVVVTAVTVVAVVTILIALDPVVGLVTAIIAATVPFVPRLWDRALQARGDDHWSAYSDMNADVADSLRGMETLKLLGATTDRRRTLTESSARLLHATLGQLRLSLLESGLTGFLLIAGPAAALLAAVVRIASGDLAAASVFTVTLLAFEAFRPFRELANHWHAGYLGVSAGGRVLAALDGEPGRARSVQTTDDAPSVIPDDEAIVFDDVTFRYPGAEQASLHGFDLRIARGSVVAVVGPSGAGKSTLVNLVLGFGDPEEGRVSVLGHAARDAAPGTVALVSQDPVLFSGTIRENLRLVAPGASDDDLAAALERAHAADLVAHGLDSPVGDGGALLSGGERQRVAIARALLMNAPIIVLDEASSALDARAERHVLGDLRAATLPDGSGVTVLVIAHRLAALRHVDEVIVVDDGRVVERGGFDELAAGDGLFARLLDAQTDRVDA
ncbi:ATP-binding cassette domain-containing protein [Agromyces atrinae]|uniref:ATP-binding cassette domain-containing protein n=1 Tax=Agromyces atrinae TaxID=592376 RepID=A0A4Q2MEW5_9MICO|nr:ATP-binding cassette domain-containing protein [Agromyces atrinae]